MKPWLKVCGQGARFCLDCLGSFCLWTLWLALIVLLGVQLYLATARRLEVPDFLRRDIEQRLSASGVGIAFDRAVFDPSGSILIENARITVPLSDQPALTARSLYLKINPWALLVRQLVPVELQADGVDLWVPPTLSASGRSDNLLRDVNLTLTRRGRNLVLRRFTARLGNLTLTAGGVLPPDFWTGRRQTALPLDERLAQQWPQLCRQLVQASQWLGQLDAPLLHLQFAPGGPTGVLVQARLIGHGAQLAQPGPVTAGPFRLSASLPLPGRQPFDVRLNGEVESLLLPRNIRAGPVAFTTWVTVNPGTLAWQSLQTQLRIAALSAEGAAASHLSARLSSVNARVWRGDVLASVEHQPLELSGGVNLAERSASLHGVGLLSPGWVEWVGRRQGRELSPFLAFGRPPAFDLTATFLPGWKFAGVEGRVAAPQVTAHGVFFDFIGGRVSFDGRQFTASDARARIGSNFTRGSFEQAIATHRFRFLLYGRLKPAVIDGLFPDWWPEFWDNFSFPAAQAQAEVDIQGQWHDGDATHVFVWVDSENPVVRDVPLDHAITRLFLRPGYYDVLEAFGTKGARSARGRFTLRMRDDDDAWRLDRLDFAFKSTLSLPDAAKLAGPEVERITAPFVLAQDPQLSFHGSIDRPAPPALPHQDIQLQARTAGGLSYRGIPLDFLDFQAALRDDDVKINSFSAGIAGGTMDGRIDLSGPARDQRLGFDLNLQHASLPKAAAILAAFNHSQEPGAAPPAGGAAYISQASDVTLNLDLSADGRLHDPYSFTGNGRAELQGSSLAQIRLLGLLSNLLDFTSLRFTSLRAPFTVDKSRVNFPEVDLAGANSAMIARGSYDLRRRALDFNARIYPFGESKLIFKSLAGLMLAPLSTVLEVKLTGSLDKPTWAFVLGPTNLLHTLGGESPPASPAPANAPVPPNPAPAAVIPTPHE